MKFIVLLSLLLASVNGQPVRTPVRSPVAKTPCTLVHPMFDIVVVLRNVLTSILFSLHHSSLPTVESMQHV
jgi:hypothetical protein